MDPFGVSIILLESLFYESFITWVDTTFSYANEKIVIKRWRIAGANARSGAHIFSDHFLASPLDLSALVQWLQFPLCPGGVGGIVTVRINIYK